MTDVVEAPSIAHMRSMKLPFKTVSFESEKGTANISKALGAPLHLILKTLVFQGRSTGKILICLVGGDQKLDTEKLSAIAGETVGMAMPGTILEETGYRVGAIPAFGLKKPQTVFIEKSLFGEPKLYVGSGKFGTDIVLSAESLRIASAGNFEVLVS